MSARTYFHSMAHHARELPGCGAALLALDCPEAESGHPLLQWLPVDNAARLFGALELLPLLGDERVRALRDVACQCGQMRFLNERGFVANGLEIQSVAIAPLSCPAGVAGYIVLVEAVGGGFTQGDARLLNDYLATAMRDVENNLRALCALKESSSSYSHFHGQDGSVPVDGNSMRRVVAGMKNDLISMVSHELRAPLTAIKGYAGLLQAYGLNDRQLENTSESTITPARQQHYLDIIMDQARHLEILMGDLLDVSRIQSGKLALRYTEIDVDSLCQQVIRLVRQRVEQAGQVRHRLRCEVSPDLPPFRVDASRLQQILHNVLDNAVKYSPDGGLIELQVGIEDAQTGIHPMRQPVSSGLVAYFTVRDQGIGISPQQRARLFQPFSRLDHPVTAQVQGAGLGLYITQKLVEAMQGTIVLISQENKGTCVTIRFPLQQPREARQLQPLLPGEMNGGRS